MVLEVFAESKLCVVSVLKGYSSQKHILDLNYESTALLKMKKYFKNNVKDPMLGFRKRFFLFCFKDVPHGQRGHQVQVWDEAAIHKSTVCYVYVWRTF